MTCCAIKRGEDGGRSLAGSASAGAGGATRLPKRHAFWLVNLERVMGTATFSSLIAAGLAQALGPTKICSNRHGQYYGEMSTIGTEARGLMKSTWQDVVDCKSVVFSDILHVPLYMYSVRACIHTYDIYIYTMYIHTYIHTTYKHTYTHVCMYVGM